MTFIILEDEMIAAQRLARMVKEIYPEWQQTGVFESVEELAGHLLSNGQPDVLFMDIQVADGNSFELFQCHRSEEQNYFYYRLFRICSQCLQTQCC
ncbi:MAG: hypothetical protein IPH36_05330 [Saprospiraceae bacterium]|nr:hypothetical protein [Saprospiraceae bacterium]